MKIDSNGELLDNTFRYIKAVKGIQRIESCLATVLIYEDIF